MAKAVQSRKKRDEELQDGSSSDEEIERRRPPRRIEPEDTRTVHIDNGSNPKEHVAHFPTNHVSSTKYQWWNIVPKNLFEQFQRVANFWFLTVSVLQMLPLNLSPTSKYATLFPLCCVLLVTFIKDAYEDYGRRSDDQRVNNQSCNVIESVKTKPVVQTLRWEDLTVGRIVRVARDEAIPADMVLLSCSEESGVAHVDTAQLDGETSLKPKFALRETLHVQDLKEVINLEGKVESEQPNELVQSFNGTLYLRGMPRGAPVSVKNFLLRGSTLRNTEFVFGVVVFTGFDTKVMRNLKKTPFKRSNVEVKANWLLLIVFGLLLVAATGCAVARAVSLCEMCGTGGLATQIRWVWPGTDVLKDSAYLAFITFMIGFNNLIPISLYVTLDVVRTCQGLIMERDKQMYHPATDSYCRVKTSALNENLGQVQFVLTDKTGTLTENDMRFKACSVGGKRYFCWDEAEKRPVDEVVLIPPKSVCTPLDPNMWEKQRRQEEQAQSSTSAREEELIRHFFLCLVTCHTAIVEESTEPVPSHRRKNSIDVSSASPTTGTVIGRQSATTPKGAFDPGEIEMDDMENRPRTDLIAAALRASFRSPSPDEEALVAIARDFGYFFRRNVGSTYCLNICGEDQEYNVLVCNEFTSDRKRMSVLVQRKEASDKSNDSSTMTVESASTPLPQGSTTTTTTHGQSGAFAPAGGFGCEVKEVDISDMAAELQIGSGPVTLYAKGADNVMLERLRKPLNKQEAETVELAKEHMQQFASYGLRTLVCARRELTPREAATFVEMIDEAKGAFMDREQMLEEVADEMEQKMELLGVTAVEDRVQDGVPDTIDMLLRAGVKVWMLTGDNMDTAINIGLSSKLIESTMMCYKLDPLGSPELTNPTELETLLKSYYQDVGIHLRERDMKSDSFRYYVVLHGQLLYTIMDEKQVRLRQLFLALACSSCSLIACRLAPAQKAALVKMVRGSVVGSPLTLSIGDGGNDVSMIQEAHVGVGILGLEGRQAANAADFSIGQFRFLQHLLFVHGRWNLRRISIVICYCFYKNFLLVPTMVFYVPFAGFSGTTLYDSYLYASWNVIFTSLPILALGVFDIDVCGRMALLVPSLYQLGLRHVYFNWKMLVGWIVRGLFHAAVTFFLMIMLFSTDNAGYHESDYLVMGCWSYGVCVIVANQTLLIHMKAWMDWSVFLIVGSVLSFVAVLLVYSIGGGPGDMVNPEMAGVATALFGQPRLWLAAFLATAACGMAELAHKFTVMVMAPDIAEILMEVQACGTASDPGGQNRKDAWVDGKPSKYVEDFLKTLPTPPMAEHDIKPEENICLIGHRKIPANHKLATVVPSSDIDEYDPFVTIQPGRTERFRTSTKNWFSTLWRKQWCEIPVEEWWRESGYDQLYVSKRAGSRRARESKASASEEVNPEENQSDKPEPSSRKSSHQRASFENGMQSSQGEAIVAIAENDKAGAAEKPTSDDTLKDNVYSMVTLFFQSSQQETAFKKYFSRQAIQLLQRSILGLCSAVLLYNIYDLMVHGGTVVSGLVCIFALPCATASLCFLREDLFEVFGVAFFICLILAKHGYDTMVGNNGFLANSYLPVFIIAGERIRFLATSLVLIFHVFMLFVRYVGLAGVFPMVSRFEGMPETADEFTKYWVSMLGITLLSLYYAYQLEKLMRKDFVGLNSIHASRHQMLEILRGIFPEEVINHICSQMQLDIRGSSLPAGWESSTPRRNPNHIREDRGIVTVIFCDISDFDAMVGRLQPTELVQLLDHLWMCFDRVCDKNGVMKIETVGKTYMAAAMAEDPREATHEKNKADAQAAVTTGLGMLSQVSRRVLGKHTRDITKVSVRIGIHSGIVLSGVVGSQKPQFALFGDTVNTASRMQSTGVANGVHISNTTYEYVKDMYEFEARKTEVKGKGVMDTYLIKRTMSHSGNHEELAKSFQTSSTSRQYQRKPTYDCDAAALGQEPGSESVVSNAPSSQATPNNESNTSFGPQPNFIALTRRSSLFFEDVKTHILQRSTSQAQERRPPPGESLAKDAAMEMQWVSYMAFLAWYVVSTTAYFFQSGLDTTEEFISLGIRSAYLALASTVGIVLNHVRKRTNNARDSRRSVVLQDSISVSLFMGYVVSVVTNQFFMVDLAEFWSVFEAFMFAMVLMQICRINLESVAPVVLCCFVLVISTTIAGIREGQELLMECVISAMLLSGTQIIAFMGDPRRARGEHQAICEEHLRVSELLDSMLPHEVLTEIKLGHLRLAYLYEDITFLFADIVGFTKYCASHTPEQAVNLVTRLFAEFDDQTAKLGIYKVCTIGDAYVVVNEPRMTQTDKYFDSRLVFSMAKWMLGTIVLVRQQVQHPELDMRIGLHHGRFVGGVIGTKRLRFDMWGEDVLIANHVESNGRAGQICVSHTAKEVLEVCCTIPLEFTYNNQLKIERPVHTYICTWRNTTASSATGPLQA
eukprot:TRINITY_DN21522_c0_g1_i1.p1 TRINITY_DN21522_c0_g1~~TRINITY_DN21522_c0_g1_i1.p1  ORF type:complete len:2517 (+),score=570.63 TRINITY_DN21522_c0_g1_i1:247-7551(+)